MNRIYLISENILIGVIEEANKYKELAATGKLSQDSLDRINKAGVNKSDEEIIAGINRGTDNILSKHGIEQREAEGYGASSNPSNRNGQFQSNSTIHVPKSNGTMMDALARRHEAIEGREMSRHNGEKYEKGKENFNNSRGNSFGHFNNDVVKREKEVLDSLAHKQNKDVNFIKQSRHNNGEYNNKSNGSTTSNRNVSNTNSNSIHRPINNNSRSSNKTSKLSSITKNNRIGKIGLGVAALGALNLGND